MKYVFVALLALLCAAFADGHAPVRNIDDYGLLNAVENCDVVAVGTVEILTGVWRENVSQDGRDSICTDVTFRIETLIKGQPNLGTNYIKFMYEDGEAYLADEGAVISQKTFPGIEFKVGEKVLLLLQKGEDTKRKTTYAYGGMRVYKLRYGKRLVKDGKVDFRYLKDGKAKGMNMTLDLATNLAKAFVKNPDAARGLENEIKREAKGESMNVSDTLSTRLISSAKLIKKVKK